MHSAAFFVALLSIAPPAEGEAPAPELVTREATGDDYAEAIERVRKAQRISNENPEAGAQRLRDAIALLQAFGPKLARDPEGQEVRSLAQLMLARALLASNEAEGARAVMDEAIRTSRGDPLPTSELGPGLDALYRERRGVLAKLGRGSIAVDCSSRCSVYINERPTQRRTDGLVLGRYRVWVESDDGSQPALQTTVDLSEATPDAALRFGATEVSTDVEAPQQVKRIAPRWLEISTLVVGVAAVGVGAALWAIDGRCPGGADPLDTAACPQVYITQAAGITTLALGGAVALTGSVMLAVDEVRVGRQRGRQVGLTWTLRF